MSNNNFNPFLPANKNNTTQPNTGSANGGGSTGNPFVPASNQGQSRVVGQTSSTTYNQSSIQNFFTPSSSLNRNQPAQGQSNNIGYFNPSRPNGVTSTTTSYNYNNNATNSEKTTISSNPFLNVPINSNTVRPTSSNQVLVNTSIQPSSYNYNTNQNTNSIQTNYTTPNQRVPYGNLNNISSTGHTGTTMYTPTTFNPLRSNMTTSYDPNSMDMIKFPPLSEIPSNYSLDSAKARNNSLPQGVKSDDVTYAYLHRTPMMHDEDSKTVLKSHSISHIGDYMPFSHEELRYLTYLKKKNSENQPGRTLTTIDNNSKYADLTRQSKIELYACSHEVYTSTCFQSNEKHRLDSWKRDLDRGIDETFNGLNVRINPNQGFSNMTGNNFTNSVGNIMNPMRTNTTLTTGNNFTSNIANTIPIKNNPFSPTSGTTSNYGTNLNNNLIGTASVRNQTGSYTNPLTGSIINNPLSNPSSVNKNIYPVNSTTGNVNPLGITNYFPSNTSNTNTISTTNQLQGSFTNPMSNINQNNNGNIGLTGSYNFTNPMTKSFGNNLNTNNVTNFTNPMTNNNQGFNSYDSLGSSSFVNQGISSNNFLSNQYQNNTMNPNYSNNNFFTNQSQNNNLMMTNSLNTHNSNYNTLYNSHQYQTDQFGNPIFSQNHLQISNPYNNLSSSQIYNQNTINPNKQDFNKILDTAYQSFQSSRENLEAAYNITNRDKLRAQLLEIAILDDLRKPLPKKKYSEVNLNINISPYNFPDELSAKEREALNRINLKNSVQNNKSVSTNSNLGVFNTKKQSGGSQYDYTWTMLDDANKKEDNFFNINRNRNGNNVLSYTTNTNFRQASTNVKNNLTMSNSFSQNENINKTKQFISSYTQKNNFLNSSITNPLNLKTLTNNKLNTTISNPMSQGSNTNPLSNESRYIIHILIESPFSHSFKLKVRGSKILVTIFKTSIINNLNRTDGLEAVRFEMDDFEIVNIDGKLLTGANISEINLEALACTSKSAPSTSKNEGETGHIKSFFNDLNTAKNLGVSPIEFHFKISFYEKANYKLDLLQLDTNFIVKIRNSTSKNSQSNHNFRMSQEGSSNKKDCVADYLPTLTKNYIISPDLNQLGRMSPNQLQHVSNFKIWNEHGKIEYQVDLDLTGVNLDCICLEHKTFNIEAVIGIYNKLKKYAIVTLRNYGPDNEKEEMQFESYVNSILMTCKSLNWKYIDYYPVERQLKFAYSFPEN